MVPRNNIPAKKAAPENSSDRTPELKYLSSWKEIANYMGKGVRTVQRYEAQFGLPVKRPAGKSRAAVVATRAEIDTWIESSPAREALRRSVGEIVAREPELREIREGIREMHDLRAQMQALRKETNSSLNMLLSGLALLMKSSREQRTHSEEALESAVHSSRNLAWHAFHVRGESS